MRSHTALRDSDSLALRVARAVPLDERDAFLAAHGGDEVYTLPPIWTAAPVKAAVVTESVTRESAADPSLIPPKDAYSIGEPVLVACFLETSSSSEGAADDNSTAKWRPAVVTAFGGDGDGVGDGQDATPPGDGVVGALEDAGYSVVFDDDAIEPRSGVPGALFFFLQSYDSILHKNLLLCLMFYFCSSLLSASYERAVSSWREGEGVEANVHDQVLRASYCEISAAQRLLRALFRVRF